MKKSIVFLMLTLAIISLSAVCASENATDGDVGVIGDDAVLAEVSNPEIIANDSGDGSEIIKSDSEIQASSATGYESFSTKFTLTLTSNGTALASKNVTVSINGNSYVKTTDSSGKASLSVKLAKGSYNAKCYFAGDDATNPSNATAKITVKSPIKTHFKVVDKSINYRQGSKSLFAVYLLTSSGAAVKNKKVTFKVNGKTYKRTTDSRGSAQMYVKLKAGKHKVSYSFKATSPYLASSGSTYLKVKNPITKGHGYWVLSSSMYSLNLKKLKSKGTKQIFLHSYAINNYGRSAVSSWAKQANKYGMKVHIWVQVFYDGKWVIPLKKDGSINYGYMKKKVAEVVSYAKISGISGVHLDYVRFPGTAQNYGDSVDAVNYFVKKACSEVRKVKPNCIISAAVMPEPGMTEYYYGQDISTMSKYLDVIIPMAYKGNYVKKTSWITYVTKAFVLESNSAQIWTGIQAYKSDDNPKLLPSSELLKDAKAAKSGGAKGVVLFRIGYSKLLNFNRV